MKKTDHENTNTIIISDGTVVLLVLVSSSSSFASSSSSPPPLFFLLLFVFGYQNTTNHRRYSRKCYLCGEREDNTQHEWRGLTEPGKEPRECFWSKHFTKIHHIGETSRRLAIGITMFGGYGGKGWGWEDG